jgi:hypothetical protein
MYTPAGRKVPPPSTFWPSLKDKGVQQAFTDRVDTLLGDSIPSFMELVRAAGQAATLTLPKLTKRAQKSCLWKEDATIRLAERKYSSWSINSCQTEMHYTQQSKIWRTYTPRNSRNASLSNYAISILFMSKESPPQYGEPSMTS